MNEIESLLERIKEKVGQIQERQNSPADEYRNLAIGFLEDAENSLFAALEWL